MNGAILNILIIFGTLFGIVYVIVSSRTKIKLALVEKGAPASMLHSAPKRNSDIFSIILINLSLLLGSVGIGIFVAAILATHLNVAAEVAYPGSIFTFAGLGLFVGYLLSSKVGNKKME